MPVCSCVAALGEGETTNTLERSSMLSLFPPFPRLCVCQLDHWSTTVKRDCEERPGLYNTPDRRILFKSGRSFIPVLCVLHKSGSEWSEKRSTPKHTFSICTFQLVCSSLKSTFPFSSRRDLSLSKQQFLIWHS